MGKDCDIPTSSRGQSIDDPLAADDEPYLGIDSTKNELWGDYDVAAEDPPGIHEGPIGYPQSQAEVADALKGVYDFTTPDGQGEALSISGFKLRIMPLGGEFTSPHAALCLCLNLTLGRLDHSRLPELNR